MTPARNSIPPTITNGTPSSSRIFTTGPNTHATTMYSARKTLPTAALAMPTAPSRRPIRRFRSATRWYRVIHAVQATMA